MMGVKELWNFEEMRNPMYADFVFSDAAKMIDQLYKVTDAPIPIMPAPSIISSATIPMRTGRAVKGCLAPTNWPSKWGVAHSPADLAGRASDAWAVIHLVNTERHSTSHEIQDLRWRHPIQVH